ncbi:PKD domain-containing protein [Lewinella sp. JB7]|uniref:PKD domain-containing protein n=1 Tax=Lewinella sp. JB7 TaxID=2962887 RepID=UPI0020C98BBD|nr:PKD domain-containing protein [Lewinella sp. JB7]MCP9237333.1 PKD domain-containing protein [Lewinella sp. JB7]
MNTLSFRSIMALGLLIGPSSYVGAQSACGEEDPFLLPPARTFCVDTNDVARISFNLINQGEPGNYNVAFPDGTDTTYIGIATSVQVEHDLYFHCSNPPGSPDPPRPGAEFYTYKGQLVITRTDCVDEDQKPQIGTYPFNVLPNPIQDIVVDDVSCRSAPYGVDLTAKVCNEALVSGYRWFVDGEQIEGATARELKGFVFASPGVHTVGLAVTTHSDKCESFTFERTIEITTAPSIELDYQVDSSALCSPLITVTTRARFENATFFRWTSTAPDVHFSDPTAANPVITILNGQASSRHITVTAGNDHCDAVSESFTISTYGKNVIRPGGPLTVCSDTPSPLCDQLVYEHQPRRIRWSSSDPIDIDDPSAECPEIRAAGRGVYTLYAHGIDICGLPFADSLSVRVRDGTPLTYDFSAVDTLCAAGGALPLLDFVDRPDNVSAITGKGITGNRFDPTGLSGPVAVELTDSCGLRYAVDFYVIPEGRYIGGNLRVCHGGSLDLQSVQEGEYSGPGVTDNVFVSAGLPEGKYSIHYESTAFCGGGGDFTVTVDPVPVADFFIANTACRGGGAAGATYTSGEPIQLVNRSNAPVLSYAIRETGERIERKEEASFTLSKPGTYGIEQVVATPDGSCTDTLLKVIEIVPTFRPTFTFRIDSAGCDSLRILFHSNDAPSGAAYTWAFSTGESSHAENPVLSLARPHVSSVLQATVVATDGCTSRRDTLRMPLPRRFQIGIGILNDNNTVCSGDTVFLVDNSVNAHELRFTFPDGRVSETVPPYLVVSNESRTVLKYPIRVDGTNPGCPSRFAVDTLYVLPVTTEAAFSLNYDESCSPTRVEVVNHSTPGSSGQLSWGDGTMQHLAAGDTAYHTYTSTRDSAFLISLVARLCGRDTFATHFTVRGRPDASFRAAPVRTACVDEEMTFVPTVSEPGTSFEWHFGDGYTSRHPSSRHTYRNPGHYLARLHVVNENGCRAVDSLEVAIEEYAGPPLNVVIPPAVCVNAPLNIAVIGGGTPAALTYDYGNMMRTREPVARPYQQAGQYIVSLTATDHNGCRADTSAAIAVHPEFRVAITPTDPVTVEFGTSLDLTFSMSPERHLDSIRWEGHQVHNPHTQWTEVVPHHDGIYRLRVTDEYGCLATDSLEVFVRKDYEGRVYAPNVFSPNGDGHNDAFALAAKPHTVREVQSLRIIDQWGTMVYECRHCPTDGNSTGWDGNIGGRPARSGVYLWAAEIEFVDGSRRVLTGDLTLIR